MRRAPLVPVALVLMACLALGRPLLHRFDRGHWTHNCPEKTFITLRLTESPQPRAKSYRAFAQVTAINDQPRHGDITVYLRKDSIAGTLCYGDHLLLLVTCDYTNDEGRFILALRQLRPDESEANLWAQAMQAEVK